MDEKDLNRLQSLDVPEPSEDAKRRAIAASVAAFEAAGEKTFAETQGTEPAARLIPTFMEATWEWIMERRMLMGTVAASLLVVPFAANLIATDGGMLTRFGDQDVGIEAMDAPKGPVRTGNDAADTRSVDKKLIEKPVTETKQPAVDDQAASLADEDGTSAAPADQERTAATESKPDQAVPRQLPAEKPAAALNEQFEADRTSPAGNLAGAGEARTEEEKSEGTALEFSASPQAPASQTPKRSLEAAAPEPSVAPSADEMRQLKLGGGGNRNLSMGMQQSQPVAKARKAQRRSSNSGMLNMIGRLDQSIVDHEQPLPPPPQVEENRDRFQKAETNPVKSVKQEPVSTFSIDVDTASYAFVRRTLENGTLPRRDAVRVEEMINYFSYDYPRPQNAETPFRPSIAVYPTPWNQDTLLMHVGIKGHDIVTDEKPRSNLVFLIDVSGSMQSKDKLPLLKSAFRLLVNRLDPDDTVAIVTYAGRAGTVLEPTKVSDKHKILSALDRLRSGGSTAGAAGIRQAYALAQSRFNKEGVNRVILATDGDFNVGISNVDELKRYIEKKRRSGVFLSVLGFGQGNYNDHLMQVLAQNGNGNAAYIDNLREAQKVLVEEAGSTLFPIAKDVKIQIEFNPALVREYRLVGYETRALKREDFNNDRVDAGDIGSGHTVTAIYELTPVGSPAQLVDDLRYRKAETEKQAEVRTDDAPASEYAFLKLRYKRPNENKSNLLTVPVTKELLRASTKDLTDDMRFAAAVAAFGQKLRDVPQVEDFSYDAILELASGARGKDRFGYRGEFLTLVRLAKSLAGIDRQE